MQPPRRRARSCSSSPARTRALAEVAHLAHFRTPIRFAQIEDDVWGTPAAVEAIAGHFTANTAKSMWRVRLADAGAARIGHHGFFRDQFRGTLWPAAVAWLDGNRAA